MKWNESGFRPPLCTYRLNWARRPSWGWWDDWDDTVLQTQDSKFEPWRSEAEHATSRSRRLPTILTFTRGWGRNNFVSFKPPRPGTEPRTLAWKAAVLTTTLGPPPTAYRTDNLDLRYQLWVIHCFKRIQKSKHLKKIIVCMATVVIVVHAHINARQLTLSTWPCSPHLTWFMVFTWSITDGCRLLLTPDSEQEGCSDTPPPLPPPPPPSWCGDARVLSTFTARVLEYFQKIRDVNAMLV